MIRLQLTSDNEEALDRLRNLVCQLDYSLSKYVYFDTHKTISDIYTSKKATFGKTALDKGQRKPVFLAAPIDYSSYPKDAKPGDLLMGNLTFVNGQKIDGGQFKAMHVVPPEPVKPKQITPSDGDSKDEAAQEEELALKLADAIRDVQLTHLKKLPTGSPARAKLLAEFNKLSPASALPVLETQLEGLVGSADAFASLAGDKAEEALSLANRILAIIDLKELATFYGVKQIDGAAPASSSSSDSSKSKKQLKKDSDKKKQLVVLAFRCKCLALSSLSRDQDFEDAYAALQQWLDNPPASGTDLRALILYVNRERRAGRLGNAVKALNKYLGEAGVSNDNTKDLKKVWTLRLELMGELGWTTWVAYEERVAIIRVPPAGVAPF